MAFCTFSPNNHIFDVTPVENLFIEEFMLKAPGDFVKIYLYGLMQCYGTNPSDQTIERFASHLGLDIQVVENGFRYWERQGLLRMSVSEDGQFSITYYNVKDLFYNNKMDGNDLLYQYRELNENLQRLFDSRLLLPEEYLKIYDWLEVLNLPQEVILMMVNFHVRKKGVKLSLNYLDKVAQQWAKDEINTLQKAEDYLSDREQTVQQTAAVLKHLGIRRLASKDELQLYKKWTSTWGFSLDTIFVACEKMTSIQNPNFGYLDKVLAGFFENGVVSMDQMREFNAAQQSKNAHIKDVLYHLGLRSTMITPEHETLYKKWSRDWQFEHAAILMACTQCVRQTASRSPLQACDDLLRQWHSLHLTTQASVTQYLSAQNKFDQEIKACLERAHGLDEFSPAVRPYYKRWIEDWHLPFELVLLAADFSVSANKKVPFINKILQSWHNKNIQTVAAAQQDHEQRFNKKPPEMFSYANQRDYTEDDLADLVQDLDK
jgi:DnaD/phage-associated family protein